MMFEYDTYCNIIGLRETTAIKFENLTLHSYVAMEHENMSLHYDNMTDLNGSDDS